MTVLSVVPANRLNMNEIRSEIGSPATNLFDFKWSDHILNDIQWLRADTFSWQSDSVYEAAYQHLVEDFNNSSITVTTTYYAWYDGMNMIYYTLSETPQAGDDLYEYENGSFVSYGQVSSISTDTIGIDDDHNFCTRSSSNDKTVSSDSGVHTETIGSYIVTYYLAEDGHKIVLPDMEETVANIYNETGVAWYYILDTDNQRFKLPRTKWGFTGIRDGVGNYIAESLPNITGESSELFAGSTNTYPENGGALTTTRKTARDYSTASTSTNGWAKLFIDASDSSPTYQENAPVQQRATQMYLYFYVGNYTQSAVEQTAGLNSELFNNKVDLPAQKNQSDIDFVIESQLPTAENSYTWYRLYKSGWVEQGGYKAAASSSANYQIALPVTMDNNKYHIIKTLHGGANNSSSFVWTAIADTYSGNITDNTTKIVNINVPSTSYCIGAHWEVKGMSAQRGS